MSPPLGPVSVFRYQVDSVSPERLPIRGFYQMKALSSAHVKILIQLKLSDSSMNQFEYFNVEIPFPTRASITNVELQPTVGACSLDPKRKNVLVWNIGTKISGKNLESALPGLIYFVRVILSLREKIRPHAFPVSCSPKTPYRPLRILFALARLDSFVSTLRFWIHRCLASI